MNDPRPDLNLLTVFEAILHGGSVTQAARALNLSQPAVSHALGRLRDLTGDPLFRRRGNKLIPTPRAESMAPQVAEALAAARAALRPTGFDPAADRGEVVLGASDYALLAALPHVISLLQTRAPQMRLRTRPITEDTPRALESGALLFSFWANAAPQGDFDLTLLYRETLIGLALPDHPLLQGAITLERWAASPQITISLGDPSVNPVDAQLAAAGLQRQVAMVTHSFAGALAALRQAGLLLAVPRRLAATPQAAGLRTFELPLPLSTFTYGLLSHRRARDNERLRWLAELVAEAVARAPTLP
ncbi:LysR family transcriptional regulator [Neotabrizicola sp. sgz301269]|uniref:LysR family transcriptional regulator n=1 Tax=Neotabrizicola sp. sgz301269 TaxID=3276282 RepID=UPI00376F5EEF